MPTLTLNNEQIVALVRQLPPDQKFSVLLALAENSGARRAANMEKAEVRLRELAREKGLEWDQLAEEDRIAFVDGLVHESR